jgi:FkbM family methyltransferase
MNRRQWLGGVSSSFVAGTLGGAAAGGIAGVALAYDVRARAAKISYAQQGEDLIIESICAHLSIPLQTYLDIGACDPTVGNNTYLFYCRGRRGVLVEPNPALCETLRKVRPGDTVLNVGVGPTEGRADYFVLGDAGGEIPQINTFSKDEADRVVSLGGGRRIVRVVNMPLANPNRIMEENFHGAPDFLSTDTEGFDLAILGSIDFDRYRPALICTETDAMGDGPKIVDLMRSRGYSIAGGTFVNTIFVDDRRRNGRS